MILTNTYTIVAGSSQEEWFNRRLPPLPDVGEIGGIPLGGGTHWEITEKQARKLCEPYGLPRSGYERKVVFQGHVCWVKRDATTQSRDRKTLGEQRPIWSIYVTREKVADPKESQPSEPHAEATRSGAKKGKAVNPWAVCHSQLGPEKGEKFERCVMDVKKKHKIKHSNRIAFDEEDMDDLDEDRSAKKKYKAVNPWAVCTESVGRDDKEKYERCVMDVKSKHKIKKSSRVASYGLSFSPDFFWGTEDYAGPSDRPTSVLQAVESLPKKVKVGIAKDVLKLPEPYMQINSEGFAHAVVEKAIETDRCDDLTPPITVYIDEEGYYSVTVYNEEEEDEEEW